MAAMLGLDTAENGASRFQSIPPEYAIQQTPSGYPTLSVRGTLIHSRYNPDRDAHRTVSLNGLFSRDGCFFAGCGLAYIPELYAQRYPSADLVIAEPDIFIFLSCLAARPVDRLLNHPSLVLAIGIPPGDVLTLLEQTGRNDLPRYEASPLMASSQPWWNEFALLRERNRKKRQINSNTLKRFGRRWLRNMCRNLPVITHLRGIEELAGLAAGLPVLVLAAGPSLDTILPLLPELREHMIIIAVDTAVRGCVSVGVHPDFIVVVDPQYWNYRHLDGLSCPESIVITESATWPAVFRFTCKAIFICSSLFPLGKFIEERTVPHAELGAGGSVSTSAWDFARYLGAENIVMAALDLGYPGKKTHFTGGLFEEWAHSTSGRLGPAETALYRYLAEARLQDSRDYNGDRVLTDTRLSLFVWWFESRIARHPRPPTLTITPQSTRIPGVTVVPVRELLTGSPVRPEIRARLAAIPDTPVTENSYAAAMAELVQSLEEIRHLSEQGIEACTRHQSGRTPLEQQHALEMLDRIDHKILAHPAKEIVAMVFTYAEESRSGTMPEHPVQQSHALYTALAEAVTVNLDGLKKFS